MSNRAYYDHYWSGNALNPRWARLPLEVEQLLDLNIVDGDCCLDFGCGSGDKIAEWVQRRRIQYLGVDVSENAVKAASGLGLRAQVIEEPNNLPFDDSSFDAIFSFEVLEHLFDPLSVCKEFHRLLKPDGVVVVTVPNAVELRRRIQFVRGIWNPIGDELSVVQPWRDPHIRFFTQKTLASMLEDAGFHRVGVDVHFDTSIDVPTSTMKRVETTRIYRYLSRRFPALLGVRLNAIARKGRDED